LPRPDGNDWVYLVREDVVYRGTTTTRSIKRVRIAVSDRSGRTLIDDETRIMGGDLFGWIEWKSDDSFTVTVTDGGVPPDTPPDVAKRPLILSVLGYRRDVHTGRFVRDDPPAAAASAR